MDPITRDFYEERRRRWRRSAFWRGVLVTLFLLAAAGALGAWLADMPPRGPHIARVLVEGVIGTDRDRSRMLRQLRDDADARAVIVRIDSPGGTVVGAEALYDELRAIAAERPVAVVMDGAAASGGYLAALAGDRIFARGNTITGSIGVIFEYPVVTGLMDRIGVGVETIRSSDLKAAAAPWRELSEEARRAERALVQDSYAWFRGLVGERRGLQGAALDRVTDGRTFTGRMALERGLVDAIGDEETARGWLEQQDPALSDLGIATWTPPAPPVPLWQAFFGVLGVEPPIAAGDLPSGPRLMSILR